MEKNHNLLLSVLKNVPLILFVGLFIIFGILDERFFDWKNLENIASTSAYIGILGVGMTFVLLTGGIDLSVGSTMYITGAILTILLVDYEWGLLPAMLAGVLGGTLWGCLNAFLISKVKIIPFMVTLGTLTAGRGLGLLITQSRHISVPPEMRFGATRVLGLPIPILMLGVVVLIAQFVLSLTPFGRQIYAMGNDPEAAKKAGLNTDRLTAATYIISGFCAAIATLVAVSQQGSVSSSFGKEDEFDAIAAAVLGGTSLFGGIGNVFPGTVIGTMLVQLIANGMVYLQIDLYLQGIVTAAVIFIAVFIDAQRMGLLKRLERRNIRAEEVAGRLYEPSPAE